ncbi:MAG: hypothetical protein ACPLSJ_00470 [Thermosulfidibacteraceae bacterium]|jgi:uncharacterized membrane protein
MSGKWIEYMCKAWESFIDDIFSFVPEESKKHIKNARKEVLLALRAFIDKRIEEIESKKNQEIKKIEVEEE